MSAEDPGMDIVCLGEMLVDMFPAEVGRPLVEVSAFHPKPGGAPANVAAAAARLGAETAFIGKVGEDLFGHFLAGVLARERVSTRGLRFDATARTTMAIIGMPDANSAEFVFYRNPGADLLLRPDEVDGELIRSARALHFSSISLSGEPVRSATHEAVRIARAAGALVSFDINYRPTLWESEAQARDAILALVPQAHLIKMNRDELALLSGSGELEAGTSALLALGPAVVVVTLGPEGCFGRLGSRTAHVPGFQVETVDAIGCGDAFMAALLSRLVAEKERLGELSLDEFCGALRYANAAGALTATARGVIPALPTASAVEEFLKSQG